MHRLANPPVGAREWCALPQGRLFAGRRRGDLLVDQLLLLTLVRVYFHLLRRLVVPCVVRALVEAREQEVEHDCVGANEVREGDREVAIVLEQQLERVHHDEHELDLRDRTGREYQQPYLLPTNAKTHHLHHGQVLLPPEVLLHLGSHGGQHVVGVHDNMDEGVQETEEARVATGSELDAPPHRGGHNSVVDDVQGGHLVVPLAHDEEERVKELGELGEEVPPTAVGHSQSLRTVPVDGLATQTVSGQPAGHAGLVEDPCAKDDLDGVVDDQDGAQLERLAIFHQPGTDYLGWGRGEIFMWVDSWSSKRQLRRQIKN